MSPIGIEELEKKGQEVGTGPKESVATKVMATMKKNPKMAYTQADMAKELKIGKTHANQVLRSLVEKGVVRRAQVDSGGKTLIYYALVK
jgi:predicted transcriptional regulator